MKERNMAGPSADLRYWRSASQFLPCSRIEAESIVIDFMPAIAPLDSVCEEKLYWRVGSFLFHRNH